MSSLLDPKEPPARGRFIDAEAGALLGEAAQQQTRQETAVATPGPPAPGEIPTYFDQPVLQLPVWKWSVPVYFYVGGTAGAALVLGAAARALDGGRLRELARRCDWIGAGGILLGTGLLISDLGRPTRFLNMLRVFRPTSPLSVGSWLLTVSGPPAAGAALFGGGRGPLGKAAEAAAYAGGVLGMPLAGYTGVVLAFTAVPIWQEARRSIPALFTASSMAGAASLLELMDLSARERRVVRRFGLVGKGAELGGMLAVEREASRVPRVAGPLQKRSSGFLWKAAKAMNAASLAASLLPGRSRAKRVAAGVLGTAGALAMRFALVRAGKVSAADPRAVFEQQRPAVSARAAAAVREPEERVLQAGGG